MASSTSLTTLISCRYSAKDAEQTKCTNSTVAPMMWTAAETYFVQVTPSSDGIQIVNGTASDTFAQGSTHTIHHSAVVNGSNDRAGSGRFNARVS